LSGKSRSKLELDTPVHIAVPLQTVAMAHRVFILPGASKGLAASEWWVMLVVSA